MTHLLHIGAPMIPTATIVFSEATAELASTGTAVELVLPSGITVNLWIFEDASTTSVDVSATREGDTVKMANVLRSHHGDELTVAAVVIENRK